MNRTPRLALGVALATGLLFLAARTGAEEKKKKPPAKEQTSADVVTVAVSADKPDADGLQTVTVTLTPQKPWREK